VLIWRKGARSSKITALLDVLRAGESGAPPVKPRKSKH
jgi:hypothetical protein